MKEKERKNEIGTVPISPRNRDCPYFLSFFLCSLFLFSACGSANKKIVTEDFAEGSLVDLSITERLTGEQNLLFFSIPKKTQFLEGYLQGQITDYAGSPIQGVVVRALAASAGTDTPEESADADEGGGDEAAANLATASFDPGVSDSNGFYRIRFTLPILNNLVDIRGRLLFNPGWEQEKDNLGKAYQPQIKESQFHLYYERARGRLTYVQGLQKTIVSGVVSTSAPKAAALPGVKSPAAEKPAEEKPKAEGGDEDMFKGFGFGP